MRHLTGGSKKEGNVTCDALLELCTGEAGGAQRSTAATTVVVQAGKAPIVDGAPEERMRVGCGSATIGIFARQWLGHVDEVIVVDDHITGVLTEHQAGRVLDMPPAGIRVRGRKSTPGRYFQVAEPGLGWGGTDITDPLVDHPEDRPQAVAWPGLRLLMVSTTGEDALYCVLDEELRPRAGRDAGRGARRRRAHRRELRAVAVHRAVHGRRRRLAARRRHREPGAADPLGRQAARRASPWAARRSTSGRAAASP